MGWKNGSSANNLYKDFGLKKFLVVTALTALAACAAPLPPKGEFVPIKQVFAENADKPFECVGYQAASDSCEGLGRSEVRGNTIVSSTLFAIDIGVPVQVRTVTRHPIVNGKSCGLIGRVKVTVEGADSPEGEAAITDMFSAMMTDLVSDLCVAYYRSGEGYFVEATTLDGELVEGVTDAGISRFFATQKKLRNLEF